MAMASTGGKCFDRFAPYYFSTIGVSPSDETVVNLFTKWFDDPHGGKPLLSSIDDIGVVTEVVFDFEEFSSLAQTIVSDFVSSIVAQPLRVLAHLGLALIQFREQLLGYNPQLTHTISVRFVGLRPCLPLAQLKSTIVGKLVSITGYVVRCGSIQPYVQSARFECPKCGISFVNFFDDGKFQPPTRCESSNCRSKVFTLLRNSAVTVDCQRIKVQENDTALADAGRVPRTVEVEMMEDLVDTCLPGDVITTVGVVKSMNADHIAGKTGKKSGVNSLFVLYLSANSITNTRNLPIGNDTHNEETNICPFTERELTIIREIAHKNPFDWVVNSICPSIFGHEGLKKGLTLGLFGGTKPSDFNRDRLSVRSDPHILVVGDPGLGKSQMLRAAAQLAPRSVYVSANTTTASGLTITVNKESGGGGDVVLEAGALVLADQGICCIDEFDKIGCDSHCLLESMEQQQVSIAKSGIAASLSTRCSVLAAANPVGGHYDCSKTINENLKLSSALLSRFDLVFILLDKPEESHDRK